MRRTAGARLGTWGRTMPESENLPAAAPDHRWHVGGLDWEYDTRRPRFHRWGVSDGCRGVGCRLNPLTAYVALVRWRRVEPRPM